MAAIPPGGLFMRYGLEGKEEVVGTCQRARPTTTRFRVEQARVPTSSGGVARRGLLAGYERPGLRTDEPPTGEETEYSEPVEGAQLDPFGHPLGLATPLPRLGQVGKLANIARHSNGPLSLPNDGLGNIKPTP